jgi:RNase P/RNase MRP subunit p29
MKKNIMLCVFSLLALFVQAQDLITKTDGTTIKGKVISFQNNRLVIQQEDETEMTLPRKAVAEIKFDYTLNKSVVAKGDIKPEQPIPSSYTKTQVPKPKPAPEPARYEAPTPIRAPEPIVTAKSVVESPGEISGLEGRVLLSAPELKEKAVGTGRVAVTVCLNTEGGVISAKFKPAGSSTLDSDLISMAVQNAREFKFSKGDNGECGVVVYKFNLD